MKPVLSLMNAALSLNTRQVPKVVVPISHLYKKHGKNLSINCPQLLFNWNLSHLSWT